MSYSKLIVSGLQAELYTYEKSPSTFRQKRHVLRDMGIIRGDVLPERQLGKRQDNQRHVALAFRRIVISNFVGSVPPIFVTFTFRIYQPIRQGYKSFNLFIKRLRYQFGENFRYIAVPEFGKQNTQRLHFHALIWGLPLEIMQREREERTLAKIWDYGFVDVVVTDGNPKVGSYLAKYMSKAYVHPEMFNQKSYVASRNILRPVFYTDFASLMVDYALDTDAPVKTKSYDTKWLGRCEYRLYQLNEPNLNK